MDAHNPDLQRVEAAAVALGEHFDSVHIFATRHEQGQAEGTINVSFGAGNWFTRYGQIKEWLVKTDERTRLAVQKEE